jgi:anti-sigma factor RsiW
MNHSKLAEKLSAYYDQRLTQPERWEMESHLEDCPSCRKTLREWQNASGFLFVKPRFSEWNEDIFTQKVMARLSEAPLAAFHWKPLVQWSFPLIGSLVAAAWVWSAVLPNLPGLASDPSLLNESGTQLASTASLAAETSYAAPSNNLTVSLVSYDEGR